MAWAVYLNETSLESIGVYVEDLGTRASAPERSFSAVQIPGRQGAVVSGDPVTAEKRLTITASIDPAARTVAALVAAQDALKALAYRALVKVIADDDSTAPRQIDGVCERCDITPVVHPMVTQIARATLTLRCPDPTWSDVTGQLIGFTSTASAIPLGTAPSGGIVRIAAPSWSANVVDPVLTYLNAAGVTIETLSFTGTLTAGTDYLEVDLDRCTVTEYASGTGANAISWLSSGDFFALDPMDGDPLNTSYPQLKVSATSGTPSATWAGTRRWL